MNPLMIGRSLRIPIHRGILRFAQNDFKTRVLCYFCTSPCKQKNSASFSPRRSATLLREFILEGPDSNLGFTNFDELNDIRIDTTKGINIYYALEDSLLKDSAYTA